MDDIYLKDFEKKLQTAFNELAVNNFDSILEITGPDSRVKTYCFKTYSQLGDVINGINLDNKIFSICRKFENILISLKTLADFEKKEGDSYLEPGSKKCLVIRRKPKITFQEPGEYLISFRCYVKPISHDEN